MVLLLNKNIKQKFLISKVKLDNIIKLFVQKSVLANNYSTIFSLNFIHVFK